MFSIFNKVRTSASAAWGAALSTWREEYTIPAEYFDWDTYEARVSRYWANEAMYNNIQYRTVALIAAQIKSKYRLYKHIRPVYNPVKRLVDMYPTKAYPGSLDTEMLETGALPITPQTETDAGNDQLVEAIKQVLKWSNFGKNKTLYPRTAAKLGDVFLKVVDDRQREKVRFEVLHPGKVKWCNFDPVGNITEVWIEYQRTDPTTDVKYKYSEFINKEMFATYRDGKPYAYYENMFGEMVNEWPNEYGFVPLFLCAFSETDMYYGMTSFHSSIPKIHELNDAASIVNDAARMKVQQLLARSGADSATLNAANQSNASNRDEMPMLFLPKEASINPVSPTLELGDAIVNVDKILAEVERDMPELAMYRIREQGELSGVAIRSMYGDAVSKFTEANGQFDHTLKSAIQACISIGGMRGYDGFEPFSLDSYDRGDLEFMIKERDIIEETIGLESRLNLTMQAANNPAGHLVLSELGYSDAQIENVDKRVLEQALMNAAITNQPTDTATAATTPQEEAKPQIFGYHLEQGVVSKNEARESLGLPPIEEAETDDLQKLQSRLSVVKSAVDTGIPLANAIRAVNLDTDPDLEDISKDITNSNTDNVN